MSERCGESELDEINKIFIENLMSCTDNILRYLQDEDRKNKLQSMQMLLSEHCRLEYVQKLSHDELTKAREVLNDGNISNLDKQIKHKYDSVRLCPNLHEHHLMKQFKEKLIPVDFDTSGLDLIATQSPEKYIDPITKKRIVNPVKNKTCGHIYEITSIKKMMERGNAKCPIVGCANRAIITNEGLVHDEGLKNKISQS